MFVAYPAAYDFMFVYWYLIRFAGESPFSHSALDLKTYAMALMGTEYRDSIKKKSGRIPAYLETRRSAITEGKAMRFAVIACVALSCASVRADSIYWDSSTGNYWDRAAGGC